MSTVTALLLDTGVPVSVPSVGVAEQSRTWSRSKSVPVMLWVVTVGLAAGTLWIGFTVEPLWALAERASAQLLDPSAYIEAVLSPELP